MDLLRYNLRTVRSYLLKEDFQFFWGYRSLYWAGCFDGWCTRTMRSKIGPMKRVARMLRGHRLLILNWFLAKGQLSSGVVEGFNAKAKLNTRIGLWFSDLSREGSRFVSCTWRPTRAKVHPQIFLRRQKRSAAQTARSGAGTSPAIGFD